MKLFKAAKSKTGYWFLFHIVFVYVVFSFAWWWYLLQKNNHDNFSQVVDRNRIIFLNYGGTQEQFYKDSSYLNIYQSYLRKKWTLAAEGLAFLSAISLGFWRIRKTFTEEIALTKQQNNFLLSITHELKSPLASLKLSTQTLQKRNLDENKVQRLVEMSMDDIERLEILVENILLASKIDSTNFKLNKDLINLSELMHLIFIRIQEKFKGKRTFESDIEENVYVHADKFSMTSVIYNLIENAIKYSKQDAFIKVILYGDESYIYMRFEDTGIGIPDTEKTKIFDRFYRIGSEDTRTTKGTGLGLFIVKQIISFHDGEILVKNNTPNGSIFEIKLPV